jgi:hypothetical protein
MTILRIEVFYRGEIVMKTGGKGNIRMILSVIAVITAAFCVTASTERPIGPSIDALNKNRIPDYVSTQQPGSTCPGRDVMICIMPDNYVPAFQTYAAWKQKSGTFIKIVKFSDIGATNTAVSCSTAIKPYIQEAYDTWKYRPSHVLLVGDAGVFPMYKWNSPTEGTYMANNISDEYFGECDQANRYQPDILIGRIPVKDTAQMANMLKRFMNYERAPLTSNTRWFKKILGISSNQILETGINTGQVETVRKVSIMIMDSGYSVDTLMCTGESVDSTGNGGVLTLDVVLGSINDGCTFVNYRGQGWAEGWKTPCYQFYINNLPGLKNVSMLPFLTGIGCGIAQFDATSGGVGGVNECFGEELLRLGSTAAPRGAIAVLGPTGETHSFWNNALDIGIYEGVFKSGL